MKRLCAALALLLLLTGCSLQQPQGKQYAVLISGGEVITQLPVTGWDTYPSGRVTLRLADGHEVQWYGDYLITDVPVDTEPGKLSLQGG